MPEIAVLAETFKEATSCDCVKETNNKIAGYRKSIRELSGAVKSSTKELLGARDTVMRPKVTKGKGKGKEKEKGNGKGKAGKGFVGGAQPPMAPPVPGATLMAAAREHGMELPAIQKQDRSLCSCQLLIQFKHPGKYSFEFHHCL